jgi:5-methylcytosine-specific restriction endonuclease McrA
VDRGVLRREVTSQRIERSDKIEFEQKWKIEGVVSEQVKAKLDRCKSLLSRKYPRGVDYETLFNELSEVFLERFDPELKKNRRQKREANEKRPAKTTAKARLSRHIPAREKERVWTRDGGRCAYVGPYGKRCNSTFGLQIDHFPIPFARGGPSKAGNLRLLCARHNRYTARQVFGHLCDERRAVRAPVGKHTEPLTNRRE